MNTNPPLQIVHIRRRFAVILEDCIETVLPDDIDATDEAAVDEWATENYDTLLEAAVNARDYGPDTAHFGFGPDSTRFLWEDEHQADLDIDDEFIVEIPER